MTEPRSPILQADSLPAEPQGKPNILDNSQYWVLVFWILVPYWFYHLQIISLIQYDFCCCFVDGFLYCGKALSLIGSHLFVVACIYFVLGGRSKKKSTSAIFISVLPISSSRSLWFPVLPLGLSSILSLFLYMHEEMF